MTPAGSRSRSEPSPRGATPRQMSASVAPLTQRRRCTGPNSATGRPATVTVRVSPASARRSTSPTWLRSSFCAIWLTLTTVAELLPYGLRKALRSRGVEVARRRPTLSTDAVTYTHSLGMFTCGAPGATLPPRAPVKPKAGAGHSRDFDDQVAWLVTHTAKSALVELLRVAWRTVGSLISRVVASRAAGADEVDDRSAGVFGSGNCTR